MYLRIGHRGAAGTHPENTLVSFRRALELGADGVELDLHRTRDGELVVIHDATLDRTTNGHGLVKERTLAEIRQLDAGAWKGSEFAGERVPTFREVLREFSSSLMLFVELKAGSIHYPRIEEQVLRVIRAEGAADRVQVSSFDHQALQRIHQLEPRLPLGLLFAANLVDPVQTAREVGATALHPAWEWVTPEMVQKAHASGMKVHAWTANDPQVIRGLKAAGVDGIISDYPDRLS